MAGVINSWVSMTDVTPDNESWRELNVFSEEVSATKLYNFSSKGRKMRVTDSTIVILACVQVILDSSWPKS